MILHEPLPKPPRKRIPQDPESIRRREERIKAPLCRVAIRALYFGLGAITALTVNSVQGQEIPENTSLGCISTNYSPDTDSTPPYFIVDGAIKKIVAGDKNIKVGDDDVRHAAYVLGGKLASEDPLNGPVLSEVCLETDWPKSKTGNAVYNSTHEKGSVPTKITVKNQ